MIIQTHFVPKIMHQNVGVIVRELCCDKKISFQVLLPAAHVLDLLQPPE